MSNHTDHFCSTVVARLSRASADELSAWLDWAQYVIDHKVNVSKFVKDLGEYSGLEMSPASYGKRTSEAVQVVKRLGNGQAVAALVAVDEYNADRIDEGKRPLVSLQRIAAEWAPTSKPRKAADKVDDVPTEGTSEAEMVETVKSNVTDVILSNLRHVMTIEDLETIMLAVGMRMDEVGSKLQAVA
jgi:uncharacterized Ntn-hydrolase superfamily protein